MADHIRLLAYHGGSVGNAQIRAALEAIEPDDISTRSPIDHPGALSTVHVDADVDEDDEDGESEPHWVVKSGVGDGQFTKTTQDALVDALAAVEGVTTVEVEGGYEGSGSTTTEADDSDDVEDEDDEEDESDVE